MTGFSPATTDVRSVSVYQIEVPRYRQPLFRGLAQAEPWQFHIFAADPMDRAMPAGRTFWHDCRTVQIGGHLVSFQRGVHIPPGFRPGDVAVISGSPRILSNLPLILAARRRGLGIVWWGQGWCATSTKLGATLRRLMMRRMADVCLVYTDQERARLIERGFDPARVFFTNNTIDETIIDAAMAAWPPARLAGFAQAASLTDRDVLLFCGRLTQKCGIELALQAMAKLRASRPDAVLAVIGDGERLPAVRAQIAALDLAQSVRLLGALHDEAQLAPWFMTAKGFVYPGAIGLSLNHAFAYGLPVITHGNARRQMPEFSALRPGVNGLVCSEQDADDLADQMLALLAAPERRAQLAANAFATVRGEFSMQRMVANFAAAVRAASRFALARPS